MLVVFSTQVEVHHLHINSDFRSHYRCYVKVYCTIISDHIHFIVFEADAATAAVRDRSSGSAVDSCYYCSCYLRYNFHMDRCSMWNFQLCSLHY